ncbi:hypothetical protein GALMADRAFT_428345 [Galerina marginata CBS 339.88]|uniref:Uncharacterized protein n=1 Tax=Galerina marginata (strain CBS 339.88) TaxID=685588 RepID=A0A067T1M7_GALM3|nr:hypothetical protein GALMADRAFT_428345 [Galerina marginata CBS 339.88]
MVHDEPHTPPFSDFAHFENTSVWKRKAVEEKIAACDLRLAAAEKEIQHLRATRFGLNELLNRTSLIMSTLPLDVLTEIFAVICEKPTASFDYGALPGQFQIGAVCRAWREIAWSTPKLWTTIYIVFSQGRYATQERLLREWVERAANCPLQIYLSVSYSSQVQWEPPREIFRMLLKTCHQWKSFIYDFSSISFPSALNQSKNLTFPLLETLQVHGGEERGWDDKQVWNFNSTPQLRHLNVRGHRRSFSVNINWSTLTHLSAMFELPGCVHLLTLPHSLQKLTLSVLSSHGHLHHSGIDRLRYHPRHLTSLVIEGGARLVGLLLRQMTLPALKELDIDLYDDGLNYAWISVVTELAQRSTFPLTDLTLRQATVRDEDRILQVFAAIPSIERLELDCSDLSGFSLSNRSISLLQPVFQHNNQNEIAFLPSVTTFKYKGNISFSVDCFENLIRKRIQAVKEGRISSNNANIANEFHIDITYRNISWHQNRNPNDLQQFYMAITSLLSVSFSMGVTFKLEWAEDDT